MSRSKNKTETASAVNGGWRPGEFHLAILLFLMVVAVFFRATGNDFVNYDDGVFVISNPHVKTGFTLENIRWAFSSLNAANWNPVTTLSHMLDCQIFGLRPRGHHLISVLIHALNAAGLFLLLRKMTGALWRSLVAAALFGLHPLRVESVAWIAERKDVLSMAFWLLTIWAYVRYVESFKKQSPAAKSHYCLSLLFFALGLMAKPMVVTLPFVLLLLDFWPLGRAECKLQTAEWKQLLVEKMPFLSLTLADCILTWLMQKGAGAMESGLSLSVCAKNALVTYCRYLGKLFWPAKLAVLYPRFDRWTVGQLALAAAFLAAVTLAGWLLRRRMPWVMVGWFWYLGTLVPVIGLVQVGEQSMADRFTYIPMVGISVALVWTAHSLTRHWRRGFVTATTAALLCSCATLTWRQIGFWKNSMVLFQHAAETTENNYVAYAILGDLYSDKGDPEKGIQWLQKSLEANPLYTPAKNLLKPLLRNREVELGNALARRNLWDDALRHFQAAEEILPGYPDAHSGLGVVLKIEGRMDEAAAEFREVLRLQPDSFMAHRNLGNTLADQGRLTAAADEFEAALKLKPDYFGAHCDLAQVLVKLGRRDDAVAHLRKALELRPNDPAAMESLRKIEK